ncbi:MAG: hypothetical protein OXH68_15205 [Gammaproteobacteria bacterium]|nr:hypothetical protein [Gammaproteobacteria bacterium]
MAKLTVGWKAPTHRDDGSAVVPANLRFSVERRVSAVDGVEPTDGSESFTQLATGLTALSHADGMAPDPKAGGTITIEYCVKAHESGYRTSVCGRGSITLPVGTTATMAPKKPTVVKDSISSSSITVRGERNAEGVAPAEWRFGHKLATSSAQHAWTDWRTGNTATFASLSAGTAYDMKAQARSGAGMALWSEESDSLVLMTDGAVDMDPAVPTLELTETHNSVTATVGRGSGGGDPTGYEVEIHSSSAYDSRVATQTLTAAGGAAVFAGLSPNTRYYVQARALRTGRTASGWTRDNTTTDSAPAVAFTLQGAARVEENDTTTVTITGVAPTGATFAVTGGGTVDSPVTAGSVTGSGSTRSIVFTGRSANAVAVRFTITGSATGREDTPKTIDVTCVAPAEDPACIPSLRITSEGHTSVAAAASQGSGSDCDDATEFRFRIRESGSSSVLSTSGWGSSTSHTFTGLDTDTDYEVAVQGRNSTGASSWSAWDDAATTDPCAGQTISVSLDSSSLSFTYGGSPADIPITISASGGARANAPTARVTSGSASITASIVSAGTPLSPTYALRIRSTGSNPSSSASGTVLVEVDGTDIATGTCDLEDNATVSVTVNRRATVCENVGSPALAALADISLNDNASTSFTAEATLGSGADTVEFEAASDDTSKVTVTKDGGVRSGSGVFANTRYQDYIVTAADDVAGDVDVTVTAYSVDGSTRCPNARASRTFTVGVTYVDPCAGAGVDGVTMENNSDLSKRYEWTDGSRPAAEDVYFTVAARGGAALQTPTAVVTGSGASYLTATVHASTFPNRGSHRVRLTPTGTPPRGGANLAVAVTLRASATCTNRDGANTYNANTQAIAVTIAAQAANVAPTVSVAPTELSIREGQTATFTAQARDTDGSVAAISATSAATTTASVSGGTLMHDTPIQGTTSRVFTVRGVRAGTTTINVRATDDEGDLSTIATVSVTVTVPPPVRVGNAVQLVDVTSATKKTVDVSTGFTGATSYDASPKGTDQAGTGGSEWDVSISGSTLSVTPPTEGPIAVQIAITVTASNASGSATKTYTFQLPAMTNGNGNGNGNGAP